MPARTYETIAPEVLSVRIEERRAILEASPSRDDAERLEVELGVFDCIESVPPPARRSTPRELRVAAWNLARGRHLVASTGVLSREAPDVIFLSEMDSGMARSAQQHTARDLAEALGHGYVYGVEFVELGLGTPAEAERFVGHENEGGLHGGAITCALPLARPALVRLDAGGEWLDGARGEPRVGGRIAVLATVRAGGSDVTLASVHLESHTDPDHRAEQFGNLLEAIEAYAPGAPTLIGGDLNTMSMPTADLGDPARLGPALEADPERFRNPVRHEPLFARAREAGYEWRICNVEGEGTIRRPADGGGSHRPPVRLDWFLARGLACKDARVIDAVDPATGEILSDHELLAVTVRPPAARLRGSSG